MERGYLKKYLISFVILAVIIAALAAIHIRTEGKFLTLSNWALIVAGAVVPTFTAWGLSFLFAADITDFSVGAVIILSATMAGTLGNVMEIPGILIGGLVVAVLLMSLNFQIYTLTGIPSWIAGMGMTMIYESVSVVYANQRVGRGLQVVQLKDELRMLGKAPGIYFVLLAGLLAAYFLYNKSVVGINIRAVGNNPKVCRQMGISVRKTLIFCGLIAGAFFGASGFLTESYAGRANAASGLSSISTIFQSLAAVLLAQVMQKKMNLTIAIPIATIFIMAIFNAQTQLGVRSGTWQQVVLGAIVIIFGIFAQRKTKGVVK